MSASLISSPFDCSPRSAVTVFETSDPTTVGANIGVIAQDAVQLQSKPLRIQQVVVRLRSVVLLYQSTNLPIRARTVVQNSPLAFACFGPQTSGTLNGLPLRADRLAVSNLVNELELVVQAGYRSVAFLVRDDDFLSRLRPMRPLEKFAEPGVVGLLQTFRGTSARLYEWGRRIVETARKRPEVFESRESRSAAENELFDVLRSTIGGTVEAELTPSEITCYGHSQIVRAAEDLALSCASEHLRVRDFCDAAGVSERTLQYAFKSVLGMSPVAYLTRLRLHKVRRALRGNHAHPTTVTAEAMRWGFRHFGDFSHAYKKCFGELPSVTLQNSRQTQ